MIADRLNQKKIDKKENEFIELCNLTKSDNINSKYINNPEKFLIEKHIHPEHQENISKLLNLSLTDLPEINLINKIKFQILILQYAYIKNVFSGSSYPKSVSKLIYCLKDCTLKPTNKKIEAIYKIIKKTLDDRFGDIDSFEFVKIIKKGGLLISPVINELRKKVDQKEYYFIESVNYNLLENKFILYYLLDYYKNDMQPVIQKTLNNMTLELNQLHPDSLKKLDIYKLDSYKQIFQERKNLYVPLSLTDTVGVNQDDLLELQAKGIELISLLSIDFIFNDIKSVFTFNEYSRIKLASVLYDFFLKTHQTHSVYKFYTEHKWWDEQDNKDNIPTNRKWKNHKLLRVKNIIPNF